MRQILMDGRAVMITGSLQDSRGPAFEWSLMMVNSNVKN